MSSLLDRLKRRKLFRWALGYVAGAWVVVQVVGELSGPFGVSDALQRGLVVLLAHGLLAVLVVAWYHGERGRQQVTPSEVTLLLVIVASGVFSARHVAARPDSAAPPEARPGELEEGAFQVAVLPFQGFDASHANAFYAEGLHAELIRRLSSVEGLDVRSRSDVTGLPPDQRTPDRVRSLLGTPYVVNGSVRVDAPRMNVRVALTDAGGGAELWSAGYDIDLSAEGLVGVQDSIALGIAEVLGLPAVGRMSRPPENEAAYTLYLNSYRSEGLATETEVARAARIVLRQAILLDSTFAPAYARLAFVYAGLGGVAGDSPVLADSAVHFANRAIGLDPTDPSAWFGLGQARLHQGRMGEAADAFQRASALPAHPLAAVGQYGWLSFLLGRFDDALDAWTRLIRLRPDAVVNTLGNMGMLLLIAGDFDEAERWIAMAESRAGPRPPVSVWSYGIALRAQQGRLDEAKVHARRFVDDQPTVPAAYAFALQVALQSGDIEGAVAAGEQGRRLSPGHRSVVGLTLRSMYGAALTKAGRDSEARPLLLEAAEEGRTRVAEGDERPGVAFDVASAYAALGDTEQALDWLDRARAMGWLHHRAFPVGLAAFEEMEADPRYRAWVARAETDAQLLRESLDPLELERLFERVRSGGM
ncbi:MAG: tetratricopeptide repeat protein [Longimicrobiales bacterium]|nr:tetratricopeptide repeat protein [Longimicrobiales bacterium]